MSLDTRKIQYFIALLEEGSMKRAAERHNIVQPAMSMQLEQLEAELSIQLFERSSQGIQPTPDLTFEAAVEPTSTPVIPPENQLTRRTATGSTPGSTGCSAP